MALKGIKDACLQSKERLYLANSKDLIELIVDHGLADHYPQLQEVLSRYQKRRSSKKLASGLRDNTFSKFFQRGQGRKHAASEYHRDGFTT